MDLAIFYGFPEEIFAKLKDDFDEVLCSCDFDSYAMHRDQEIEKIIPMQRFYDSFLIHPSHGLKKDGTPYKMFTLFYKNLIPLCDSNRIEENSISNNIELCKYDYSTIPTLDSLGFEIQNLPDFLYQNPNYLRFLMSKVNNKLLKTGTKSHFHKSTIKRNMNKKLWKG